jgi:hypothetical protein
MPEPELPVVGGHRGSEPQTAALRCDMPLADPFFFAFANDPSVHFDFEDGQGLRVSRSTGAGVY